MPGPNLEIQSCHWDPSSSQWPQNRADLQVLLQCPGTEDSNKDWNSGGQGVYMLSIPLGRKLLLYWTQMVGAPTLATCFSRRKSFHFQIYFLSPVKVTKWPGEGASTIRACAWTGRSLELGFQYISQQA